MAMEVSQSLQQTTYDQFHKLIKDNATNKQKKADLIVQILENFSLYTYSEFLQLNEITEVI
jgi:F0F1-type ATP synthase delta subunit